MKHLVPNLSMNSCAANLKCDTCILAKSYRVPYPISVNRSIVTITLVHSNVCRPLSIILFAGIHWFVTFVDNYTRMTWLYLLKYKIELFDVFKSFQLIIHT